MRMFPPLRSTVLLLAAATPLWAQTPTPTPTALRPQGGGVIVTATPASTPPTTLAPSGGGTVSTAATPAATPPATLRPADGGLVTTAPTPAATPPATLRPANGGLVTTAPTPAATPPATLRPANGGLVTTAPTPAATPPTTVTAPNGGVVSTAPTPIPPLAADTAYAVAHERRLVREVRENTDNVQFRGNFGAQLWLIVDSDFFLNWRKPEIPTIAPISIALRGQPIYTAIIFYGAARDEKGLANISYDITVRRPDGSVSTVSNGLVGFQNLGVTDEKELQLGRNYVSITMGAGDPAGLYTVEAVVHDNVSRVDLPLRQHFVLQPAP